MRADDDAMRVLDARLARGEIEAEEYDRVRARLASALPSSIDQAAAVQLAHGGQRSEEPLPSGSFLYRLWVGQVSLPRTYWLFHVLGSYVVLFVSIFVLKSGLVGLVFLAYWIFTMIAAWRSAKRYVRMHPSRRFWGRATQVVIVLSVVGLIGSVMKSIGEDAAKERSTATSPR